MFFDNLFCKRESHAPGGNIADVCAALKRFTPDQHDFGRKSVAIGKRSSRRSERTYRRD